MAGDWIKVEHATLDKPEVALFSELLGVPVDHGFGLLIRFWMWLDRNSCNGVVTHVSRMSIDTVTHTPGFAGALETVGWLQFDEKARSARVPNFNRHNGSSAKSRALTKNRVQRSRNDPVTVEALPEKRREEKIDTSLRSVSKAPTKKRAQIDAPTEEHERIAAERGLSCQAEFEKYRDWLVANGKRHQNEVAGFRNWLRGARSPPSRSANDELAARKLQAARNMDILTGKVMDGRERVIAAERVDSAPVFALPGRLREPSGDDVEGCEPTRSAGVMGG